MRITLDMQLFFAFGLDLLFGDPRWLPHPVKGIGWLAIWTERRCRNAIRRPVLAGAVAWIVVVGLTAGAGFMLIVLARYIHPLLGDLISTLLIYTTIAARDLAGHGRRVYEALDSGDLIAARQRVGMIVGRDTDNLDEQNITRAAVESISESTLDGVTAPLFFAALLGPVGAIAYRSANTLDSLFGHKDERYIAFGRCSARFDDVLNYVPARLSAPLVALAAMLLGMRPLRSLVVWWRDGRKHDSPNAGLCEAAFAGALGVQLGGTNWYDGIPHEGHSIGKPIRPLEKRDILRSNWLMLATATLALLTFAGIRHLCVPGVTP